MRRAALQGHAPLVFAYDPPKVLSVQAVEVPFGPLLRCRETFIDDELLPNGVVLVAFRRVPRRRLRDKLNGSGDQVSLVNGANVYVCSIRYTLPSS